MVVRGVRFCSLPLIPKLSELSLSEGFQMWTKAFTILTVSQHDSLPSRDSKTDSFSESSFGEEEYPTKVENDS